MIVIGSQALSFYVDGIKPNDLDLVGTYDEAVAFKDKFKARAFFPINGGKTIYMKNAEGMICEVEIAWEGSRAEKLVKFCEENNICHEVASQGLLNGFQVPCLDFLYLLKESHKYLKNSPHHEKTMLDIHKMRGMGCRIPGKWLEYFKDREKDTYTYKHPSLMRSKDEFFSGDGIVYTWDHDSLHEAVKHLERPAYTYFQSGEVWVDMKKFFTLPEKIKLLSVLEESLVLAAERSQLAFPEKQIDPRDSFNIALKKVTSSISSGKWREYAWENYFRVNEMYDEIGYDYMDRVRAGIDNGTVKRL